MVEKLLTKGNNFQVVVNIEDLRQVFRECQAEVMTHPTEQEETYLTRDEVCELLSVSKPTLNRWAKGGLLKPLKIGHSVRYKESDIKKLKK